MAELKRFCGPGPQADDITAIEILCDESLLAPVDSVTSEAAPVPGSLRDAWQLNLTLRGPRLADPDPVPLLMNQIHELAGAEAQQSALFTILTEWFINALDHGVLKLASNLKAERNGFEAYVEERARRLENLTDGWVDVVVSAVTGQDTLEIVVSDSGGGFDVDAYYRDSSSAAPRPAPPLWSRSGLGSSLE